MPATHVSFRIPAALAARVEAFAESRADDDSGPLSMEEACLFLTEYALNRMDTLARHKAKDRAARAGDTEVSFRRYTPLHPGAEHDAPETEAPVAEWAHVAPSRVSMPRVRRAAAGE